MAIGSKNGDNERVLTSASRTDLVFRAALPRSTPRQVMRDVETVEKVQISHFEAVQAGSGMVYIMILIGQIFRR